MFVDRVLHTSKHRSVAGFLSQIPRCFELLTRRLAGGPTRERAYHFLFNIVFTALAEWIPVFRLPTVRVEMYEDHIVLFYIGSSGRTFTLWLRLQKSLDKE